jgi:hypothetical protein
LDQQRSKLDNEHDDEHEHDLGMLTRLINRFDRDEPPIPKGLTFPIVLVIVLVLVIDSLDVTKAPAS